VRLSNLGSDYPPALSLITHDEARRIAANIVLAVGAAAQALKTIDSTFGTKYGAGESCT
jgi:hypothetical protein